MILPNTSLGAGKWREWKPGFWAESMVALGAPASPWGEICLPASRGAQGGIPQINPGKVAWDQIWRVGIGGVGQRGPLGLQPEDPQTALEDQELVLLVPLTPPPTQLTPFLDLYLGIPKGREGRKGQGLGLQ